MLLRDQSRRLAPGSDPRWRSRYQRERAESEARAKAEAEIKEKLEKMRTAIEAREKLEADTVDSARAWADTKAMDKAEISRLSDKLGRKIVQGMGEEETNATRRVSEEAVADIRVRAEFKRVKRERAESQTSAKVDA